MAKTVLMTWLLSFHTILSGCQSSEYVKYSLWRLLVWVSMKAPGWIPYNGKCTSRGWSRLLTLCNRVYLAVAGLGVVLNILF